MFPEPKTRPDLVRFSTCKALVEDMSIAKAPFQPTSTKPQQDHIRHPVPTTQFRIYPDMSLKGQKGSHFWSCIGFRTRSTLKTRPIRASALVEATTGIADPGS